MENLTELKKEYNKQLAIYKNACDYISKCNGAEYERVIPLFKQRTREISAVRNRIEKIIYRPMTSDENWNGFKI